MTPELTLALSKTKADAVRNQVKAGKHEIDAFIHVTGTLSVGKDYDTAPTVSLPMKEILALFIARSGVTREASIKLLVEATRDAIAQTGKAKGELEAVSEQVEEALATVKAEVIDKLPRQPRKGSVSAKGIRLQVLDLEATKAAEEAA